MKKIKVDEITYEIIEDNRNGYDEKEFLERYTEYFHDFDYVVGDWAYEKLRLKGFYEDNNKNAKEFNKIGNLDKYIKEKCAFGCKYFVAKKINI